MSARCSTSLALRLTIASSRWRRLLHALICLFAAFSLYRLAHRGYPLLALLLVLPAALCCFRLARQKMVGASICWRQGAWTVEQGAVSRSVRVRRVSNCLPWLIYLAWMESADAGGGSVFLFPDSAPAEQLRALRVRLLLER